MQESSQSTAIHGRLSGSDTSSRKGGARRSALFLGSRAFLRRRRRRRRLRLPVGRFLGQAQGLEASAIGVGGAACRVVFGPRLLALAGELLRLLEADARLK